MKAVPLAQHNVAKPATLRTHQLQGREVCTVEKPRGHGYSAHFRVLGGVWLRAEGDTREDALQALDARINELRQLLG